MDLAITERAGASPSAWSPPLFTHQSYEGEVIKGFSDLSIQITFSDPGLAAHVSLSYSATQPGCDPVPATLDSLALGLPCDWTRDGEVFTKSLVTTGLPSAVLGAPTVHSYTVAGCQYEVRVWKLDGSDALQEYHRRLECLAWWMIDGA